MFCTLLFVACEADLQPLVAEDRPEPPPTCGNGSLDPEEVCDDGNRSNADACLESCESAELLLHVPFDGDAVDASASARSVVTGDLSFEDGPVGQAVVLQGQEIPISTQPDDGLVLGPAYTLSLWIRLDAVTPASILTRSAMPGEPTWTLFVSDTSPAQLAVRHDRWTGPAWFTGIEAASLSAWHHLALRADEGVMTVFLDGVALDEGAFPVAVDPGASGQLWMGDGPAGPLSGGLDEVRVYGRALPSWAIADLAVAP